MLPRAMAAARAALARRGVLPGIAGACALAAGVGAAVALAGSGGLDPSFGTAGTTIVERPTSTYPTPTEVLPGGKIVVVSTSGGVITVSRLQPNGVPDPTFGGGAPVTVRPEGFPSAYALAVQPDGKIILVGFRTVGTNEVGMVWRVKADGGSGAPGDALDPTFGNKGVAEVTTFLHTVAYAVAVQPDGKVIVAGTGFNSSSPVKVAVWRLTTKGELDSGFGTSGAAEISDGAEDQVKAVALQPDGKIVLAGSTSLGPNPTDAVVWRLKADGSGLDPTFDGDGQADVDNSGKEIATSVALQTDGKIVLAGYTEGGPLGSEALVWRLTANGGLTNTTNDALDPTFGGGGTAFIGGAGVVARATAVGLQPDGKILVAGETRVGVSSASAVLWRLTAVGGTGVVNSALDPAFGAGGATIVGAGAGAAASALALQPDRRVLVAGSTFAGNLIMFRVLGDPFSLKVSRAGTGSGSVQSSPAGIACGSTCSGTFDDGTLVTLTATPSAGSAFAGWSGGGCGGAGSCALTMSSDQAVTATFRAKPAPTKATITALKETNSIFAVGRAPTPLTGHAAASRHKRGTVFSFHLDQAATVKIAIQRRVLGRRVRRRCRAESRRLRHRPRCTRVVITIATLTRLGHKGLDRVAFSGRLGGKALGPGRYQAVFTAVDSAGASSPVSLSFTIVRR